VRSSQGKMTYPMGRFFSRVALGSGPCAHVAPHFWTG